MFGIKIISLGKSKFYALVCKKEDMIKQIISEEFNTN